MTPATSGKHAKQRHGGIRPGSLHAWMTASIWFRANLETSPATAGFFSLDLWVFLFCLVFLLKIWGF